MPSGSHNYPMFYVSLFKKKNCYNINVEAQLPTMSIDEENILPIPQPFLIVGFEKSGIRF